MRPLCLLALLAAGPSFADAQDLPGSAVELKTRDGWTLKARHLPGKGLTFILLHSRGRRREDWLRLARALSRAGHGALGLDLRGHGESTLGPEGQSLTWRKFKATRAENDYADMLQDIQAAVAYLTSQGVPEERIGLIGNEVGGSLALKYAAVHPQVPILVLLSPGMSYSEIPTVNAMRAYKDRPILLVYSELDRTSAKATPILYEFARRSAGERNATILAVKPSGPRLLDSELSRRIVDWIADPVKAAKAPAASSPAPTRDGEMPGPPEIIR